MEEKNICDSLKMRGVENRDGDMLQSCEEAKGLELVGRREQCRSAVRLSASLERIQDSIKSQWNDKIPF